MKKLSYYSIYLLGIIVIGEVNAQISNSECLAIMRAEIADQATSNANCLDMSVTPCSDNQKFLDQELSSRQPFCDSVFPPTKAAPTKARPN